MVKTFEFHIEKKYIEKYESDRPTLNLLSFEKNKIQVVKEGELSFVVLLFDTDNFKSKISEINLKILDNVGNNLMHKKILVEDFVLKDYYFYFNSKVKDSLYFDAFYQAILEVKSNNLLDKRVISFKYIKI